MVSRTQRRILAGLGAVLFMSMAVIQLNDPDPLYWFVVYAGVAVVCLASAAGRAMPGFALIVSGGVIAGLLIASPGFVDYLRSGDWAALGESMQADRPYIESAREFLGLVIAGLALTGLVRPNPN